MIDLLEIYEHKNVRTDFQRVYEVILNDRVMNTMFASQKKIITAQLASDTYATIVNLYTDFKHQYDQQKTTEKSDDGFAQYSNVYKAEIIDKFDPMVLYKTYKDVLNSGNTDVKNFAKQQIKMYTDPTNSDRLRDLLMNLIMPTKKGADKKKVLRNASARLEKYTALAHKITVGKLTFGQNNMVAEDIYNKYVLEQLLIDSVKES